MTTPGSSSEHTVRYTAIANFSNIAIEARKAREELKRLSAEADKLNKDSTRNAENLARAKQTEAKAYNETAKAVQSETRVLREHTDNLKRDSEATDRASTQEKIRAERQKNTTAGLIERSKAIAEVRLAERELNRVANESLRSKHADERKITSDLAAIKKKEVEDAKTASKEQISRDKEEAQKRLYIHANAIKDNIILDREAAKVQHELEKTKIEDARVTAREILYTHANAIKDNIAKDREAAKSRRELEKEQREDARTNAKEQAKTDAAARVTQRAVERFNTAMISDSNKVGEALKRAAIAPKNDWERLIATFQIFRNEMKKNEGSAGNAENIFTKLRNSLSTAGSAGGGGGIRTIFTRIAGAAGDAFGPVSKLATTIFGFAKVVSVVSLIQPLIAVLGSLGGAALGVASSLGSLAGAALALPGLLAAALGGIGGLVVGFRGVGDVLKAYTANQKSASAAASGSADAQADAADRIKSAEDSLASAQENYKSAQDGLTQSRVDARSKLADLASSVQRAELTLTNTQRDARDAQKALTSARQDAVRQLQDMQSALSETGDREESARIQLLRAQQAVASLDETSSALDRREALLALSEAQHNLTDTLRENKRTREDYNEAQKKGVEGSDGVVSAQRNIVQSQQDLADATIAAATANKEYADAQKKGIEGSDGVISARKSLTSASRGLDSAVRQLADAQRSEAAGGSAAETAARNLKEALDRLSPSARKAAEFFIANKDALKKVQQVTQEALFKPIVGQLENLKSLLPTVTDFLSKSAGAMGDVAAKGIAMLSSGPWKADFAIIAKNNVGLLHSFGDAGLSVVTAFKDIAIAAAPFTQWIADGVAKLALNFERWAKAGRESGSINRFLDDLKPRIRLVGSIFGNLLDFVVSLGGASLDFGDDMLTSIDRITAKWADWAKKQEEPRSKLKRYFEDIKPLLSGIASLIGSIALGFGKIASDPTNIEKATGLLGRLQTEIFPKLSELVTSLSRSGVLDKLITLFSKLLDAVIAFVDSGAAKGLTSFLTTLGVFVGVLTKLIELPGVGPTLGVISAAFGTLAALSFVGSGIGLILDKLIGVGKGSASIISALRAAAGAGAGGAVPAGFPPVPPPAGAAGSAAGNAAGSAAAGAAAGGGLRAGAATVGRTVLRAGARGGIVGAVVGTAAAIVPGLLPGGSGGTPQTTGRALGAVATGAATGAAIGSVVPVVGTAIGAGIGAVAGAIYSLIKDKKLRDAVFGFFTNIGKDIGNFFAGVGGKVVDYVKGLPARIGGLLGSLGKSTSDALVSAGTSVINFFKALPGRVGGFFKDLAGTVGGALLDAGNEALDFFKALPGRVLDFLKTLPGRIAFLLGQVVGLLIIAIFKGIPILFKIWLNLWKDIGELAWNGIKAVGRFIGRLPGLAWTGIKKVYTFFSDLWTDILVLAWDGIKAVGRFFARLPGMVWTGIKKIYTFFSNLLITLGEIVWDGIKSMGRFFARLPGLIWEGIKKLPGLVWEAIKGIAGKFKTSAEDAVKFYKDLPGKILEFLKDLPDNIWNIIKKIGGFFAQLGMDIANGIISGINFAIGILNKFIRGINSVITKAGMSAIPEIPLVPALGGTGDAQEGGGGGKKPRAAASGGYITVGDKLDYVPYTHRFAKKLVAGGPVASSVGSLINSVSEQHSGTREQLGLWYDWLPGIMHKAKDSFTKLLGGVVGAGAKAAVRRAVGFSAEGGPVRGVGGPTEDNVPIWASVGEFVVNAAATKKHLALIEAINADKLATGGLVNNFARNLSPTIPHFRAPSMSVGGSIASLSSPSVSASTPSVSFGDTHISINGADDPDKIARQVNSIWDAREKRLARTLRSGRTGWS